MRRSYPPPEECPSPELHGNPWRYCPACTWAEPVDAMPRCPTCGQATGPDPRAAT